MSIQAISQGVTPASNQPVASKLASPSTVQSSNSSASSTSPKAAASTSSYTLNISNAARAMLAEARETSVQTAQEAGKGDSQAQRLLAKEQAAKLS